MCTAGNVALAGTSPFCNSANKYTLRIQICYDILYTCTLIVCSIHATYSDQLIFDPIVLIMQGEQWATINKEFHYTVSTITLLIPTSKVQILNTAACSKTNSICSLS